MSAWQAAYILDIMQYL